MRNHPEKNHILLLVGAITGVFLFAFSYCYFLRPLGLYSGGFTGIAQIISLFLSEVLLLPSPAGLDLTGIIFWMINIPLFALAYRSIGHTFFYRTTVCVCLQSLFFVFLPSPKAPVFPDFLTSVLVGGAISGFGVGLTLACGGSGGGLDIVGLYSSKRFPDFSVGRVSVLINLAIYLFCAFRYDLANAVYSAIFTIIAGIIIDKVHYQNIKTAITIISKNPGIRDLVINNLGRGVTVWNGYGGYTEQPTYIYMTVVSKNEIAALKQLIRTVDEHAFISIQNPVDVSGHFEKRF